MKIQSRAKFLYPETTAYHSPLMGGNREGRQTQLVFEPPVEKYGAFPES